MNKLSIYLLATLLMPVMSVFARETKVNISYSSVDRKYTTYEMVEKLSFEWKEKSYVIQKKSDDFMSYSILADNESFGMLLLLETAVGYEWQMNFGSDSVRVLFSDYNDPRELEIRVNEKYAWYMSNMEPDCNSHFDLYSNKAFMDKYDEGKIISSAKAKKACAKTKWMIEWKEKKEIPKPVFLAYALSSTMAMTVRGAISVY